MRRRPATCAASFRGTLLLPSRRQGQRDDFAGPTALLRSAAFTSGRRNGAILRTAALQPCGGQRPNPLRGARCRGGRNARATGLRLRAFPISPGNSPSRIAGCHQRHRIIVQQALKEFQRFAENTLQQNVAGGNRKMLQACEQTVGDETSLWKAEEKRGRIMGRKMYTRVFNNLDAVKGFVSLKEILHRGEGDDFRLSFIETKPSFSRDLTCWDPARTS